MHNARSQNCMISATKGDSLQVDLVPFGLLVVMSKSLLGCCSVSATMGDGAAHHGADCQCPASAGGHDVPSASTPQSRARVERPLPAPTRIKRSQCAVGLPGLGGTLSWHPCPACNHRMATGKNKAFELVQVGKQTEADTRQQVLAISC
jgi:hypothetical protein